MSTAGAAARTTFSTPRLLDFCSQRELTAQTGTAPSDWPLMIIREAVDNALDAAEESGVAPVVRVTVARGRIRVRDLAPASRPRPSPRSWTSRLGPRAGRPMSRAIAVGKAMG